MQHLWQRQTDHVEQQIEHHQYVSQLAGERRAEVDGDSEVHGSQAWELRESGVRHWAALTDGFGHSRGRGLVTPDEDVVVEDEVLQAVAQVWSEECGEGAEVCV
jgi:hypothetical protein